MTWKIFILLAAVTLPGCVMVVPFGFGQPLTSSAEKPNTAPKVDPAAVAALQAGSQVQITDSDPMDTFTGTVLQATPSGVVLINCVYEYRDASDPRWSKRHMPSHWIPIRRISDVKTIAPAPAHFVPSSVMIDPSEDVEYFGGRTGVVF